MQTTPRSPRSRVDRRSASGHALTLAAALCAVGACDRTQGDAASSKAEAKTEPRTEAEALPPVDPPLWALTCEEALLAELEPPPPPPPPPIPPGAAELSAAGRPPTPPAAGPFPQRHAKVPQRGRSPLPARLGLRKDACDPQPFVRLHAQHPNEESLYCAIAHAFEVCGPLEQAMQWTERRVEAFPQSMDARLALAIRHFAPLLPASESPMPFNEQLSDAERLAIAEQVIAELDQILERRPTDVLAHELAASAHIQKGYARGVALLDEPTTREEVLALLLVRKDAVAAWEHRRAAGKAENLPPCEPDVVVPRCIPPAPLTPEERQADAELEALLSGPG